MLDCLQSLFDKAVVLGGDFERRHHSTSVAEKLPNVEIYQGLWTWPSEVEVNKCVKFTIDTINAGIGTLSICVHGVKGIYIQLQCGEMS